MPLCHALLSAFLSLILLCVQMLVSTRDTIGPEMVDEVFQVVHLLHVNVMKAHSIITHSGPTLEGEKIETCTDSIQNYM